MRDVYSVLRQKELDVQRVHREIEALRVVIPLLIEPVKDMSRAESTPPPNNRWPLNVSAAMAGPLKP